jgi:hypothetical protein
MPKGTPHRVTREVNRLAGAAGPKIVRDVIKRAGNGEPFYASLFVRYLLPRSRLNPEPSALEPPRTTVEAAAAIGKVASAIAGGSLDLDTAQALTAALQGFISAANVADLEAKIEEGRAEIAELRETIEAIRRNGS